MKNFVKYINEISKNPFIEKKALHTTTILMPELDTTEGIYRSILPSYIINTKVENYRMIIAGMTERTPVSNNEKNFFINQKLMLASDHIVFPFVSYPLQPVIDTVRKCKPGMKFSYYVDFNYYLAPESYPHSKEYVVAKMIENIEMNIKAVDQVIFTSKALRDYVGDKLSEKYKEKFGTMLIYQPLFVSPDLMKTDYEMKVEKGVTKILIIGDEYHFSDINWIKGILTELKKKYKDAVKIIIIGFNGIRGKTNYLKGLNFEFKARVPFYKYFELIKHISPDIFLIPANKTPFNNTSKNYVKFMELALLNVPVIVPAIRPFGNCPEDKENMIITNQNGFICEKKEDYFMQLDSFFHSKEKFDGVLGPAYAMATDYNIILPNNVKILQSIYFPLDVPKQPAL